jgi:hypothetical protein
MGGGQWQVLRLVRGLVQRGDSTLLLSREGGELLARARAEGLPAEPFRWSRWPKSDLVHAHDARAHLATSLFANCPTVVSRRVAYPIRKGILTRLKYRRADRFIAVSRFVAGILINSGLSPAKIDVVYDGVPLLPPSTGDGPVISAANKSIEGYQHSTNLQDDLATASVFVYISSIEGLGSAILLAMSAGVPVVASKVGGIPEIVTNGEEGILVNNKREEIDTAVRKILGNPGFYSQRARQKVTDRFQESRMVEDTLTVYRKLLNNV